MTATAFVAVDPQTRRRLGVAWSELDAWAMVKRADERVTDGIAELIQVPVSRTPQRMREQRHDRAQREWWMIEHRRLREAVEPPPEGYVIRQPRRLAEATAKRYDTAWDRVLRTLRDAGGWYALREGHTLSNQVNALADRGLLLVAVPKTKGKPYLYCLTGRGLDRALS